MRPVDFFHRYVMKTKRTNIKRIITEQTFVSSVFDPHYQPHTLLSSPAFVLVRSAILFNFFPHWPNKIKEKVFLLLWCLKLLVLLLNRQIKRNKVNYVILLVQAHKINFLNFIKINWNFTRSLKFYFLVL